jgi:hypothetical protein
MSDTGPDAGSIPDASNSHSEEALLISVAVRELCNPLRANVRYSTFEPISGCSEAETIAVFKALKKNTSVKQINFTMLFEGRYTEKFALLTAEYVESSKTLQTLDFRYDYYQYSQGHEMISHLL